MKKLNYIVLVLCLALYSCGMTDVWKDWEDEGKMSPDRLKASELKKVLIANEGWKMTYKGVVFYFQFDESGVVISNTNEAILKDKVESGYYVDYKGEDAVLFTIDDLGALQYLSEGRERTFIVTSFSEQAITAIGKDGKETMDLIPATTAEIKNNESRKSVEIFMKENGVIRDAGDRFLAHYAISGNGDKKKIKISVVENRVLTHYERDLTINIDDENASLSFAAVTFHGKTVSQIDYNIITQQMMIESGLNVAINKDGLAYFLGDSFSTYKLNGHNNTGDAKEELWQDLKWDALGDVEVNDRAERPLVLCPGSYNAIYYTFYDANPVLDDEVDRVYFMRTSGYMPFGGDDRVAEVDGKMARFLGAWYDADGFYVIHENNNLYFISPTNDNWIKATK